MIVPSHVQIETVNGVCTARCTMCTIGQWTRKPNVMNFDAFSHILHKFTKWRDEIRSVTLHGCGEPLLDKGLSEKVKITKQLGFKETGFSTNCTLLDEITSASLIEAGLDTIILNIDGVSKKTHEALRVGTDFEQVLSNAKNFIKLRNQSGKTKIITKFTSYEDNRDEWPQFNEYWSNLLNEDFGDEIDYLEISDWEKRANEDDKSVDEGNTDDNEVKICSDPFERLYIYSDGKIGFCCSDDNGFFEMENIVTSDPIDIFNNEIFTYYRMMMSDGKINELEVCKSCSNPFSPRNRKKPEIIA